MEKRITSLEMFPLELPRNGLSSTRGGWCHLDLIFRFLIRKEEAVLFSDKKKKNQQKLHSRNWQFCKMSFPWKKKKSTIKKAK